MNGNVTPKTIHLEINGVACEARPGEMIIQVADRVGIYIPRFCYHPHLKIAANCRMCLVEVAKAPKPLPACATPVTEGMCVQTRSDAALHSQHATMEFLLINHPLDCPVCDQGGECELQDLAMGYGFDHSRYEEPKRVIADENVGPLISTDMTRCIFCSRCVRFLEEVAGAQELAIVGRGERSAVRSFLAGEITSELSGNIIDLCPVGALNSKPFRFAARSWEMLALPGISAHDAMGSNLYGHTLRGRLLRVVPRPAEGRNETWLSDRDRFSYAGLYHEDRVVSPKVRENGVLREASWDEALEVSARKLEDTVSREGPESVAALVSPQATLEELYLYEKLLRGLGVRNIDVRLYRADFRDGPRGSRAEVPGVLSATEWESRKACLLVGTDLRSEYPLISWRLRRAAEAGARLAALNPVQFESRLPLSFDRPVGPWGLVASLAALLGRLDPSSFSGELAWAAPWAEWSGLSAAELGVLGEILAAGPEGALVLGELVEAHPEGSRIRALAAALSQASGARLIDLPVGANALGAERVARCWPDRGDPLPLLLDPPKKLYVLFGVEPEYDLWDGDRAVQAMAQAPELLVFASWLAPSHAAHASVILPVAAIPETGGTYVDLAGEEQSFEAMVPPWGDARTGWKVLTMLGQRLGLSGFHYEQRVEILEEMRARGSHPLNGAQSCIPEREGQAGPQDVRFPYRMGRRAVYGTDPYVRRSTPLQQTPLARLSRTLFLHPDDAREQGVQPGARVRPAGKPDAPVLTVAVSNRLPRGIVWLDSGTESAVGWGPSWGRLELDFPASTEILI